MTRTSSNAIEVAIVGGGIAGLAAAAFLRKYPQYNITIFERRREDDEEHSSGLALRDGGKAIMKKLGITREEVGASPGAGYRTYTINEDLLAKVGCLKGDLKDALFRRATSEDGKGKPAKIVYNSHIVRVDPDTGTIHFANATSIHADLIIGADGIHSKVRSAIIPESHPQPAPCGISLYRFMLPMETFENAVKAGDHTPVMFQFNEDESFILMVAATDGSNCTLCCYPCEGHKTMNVACGIFDSSAQTPEELEYSWQAKGKRKN
ncbi:hypothetical protein N7470_007337 [Penicillium chermesinum]|nr:hypothetical protein N7470_007337 [Penicillium chermesinum]